MFLVSNLPSLSPISLTCSGLVIIVPTANPSPLFSIALFNEPFAELS